MPVTPIDMGPPKHAGELKLTDEQPASTTLVERMPSLIPAGISSRVSFACGCQYERVFLGAFVKPGFQLRKCVEHHKLSDQDVIDAAASVWDRVVA